MRAMDLHTARAVLADQFGITPRDVEFYGRYLRSDTNEMLWPSCSQGRRQSKIEILPHHIAAMVVALALSPSAMAAGNVAKSEPGARATVLGALRSPPGRSVTFLIAGAAGFTRSVDLKPSLFKLLAAQFQCSHCGTEWKGDDHHNFGCCLADAASAPGETA